MILHSLNESIVEDAALNWFVELGYAVFHSPDIVPCLLSLAYYVETAL